MNKNSLVILLVGMLLSSVTIAANASNLAVTSREQAVQLVKQQFSGKVLKVESATDNAGGDYRVKLLSDKGVIFYLQVDSQTGRVSKQ